MDDGNRNAAPTSAQDDRIRIGSRDCNILCLFSTGCVSISAKDDDDGMANDDVRI